MVVEANDWQPFKALAQQADGVMASVITRRWMISLQGFLCVN